MRPDPQTRDDSSGHPGSGHDQTLARGIAAALSTVMTNIDHDTLIHVTGGSKVKAAKTLARVAKTAMKWGGYAMEGAETLGMAAEGVQMIKSGYDAIRGKSDD
jgi:hypothetical protein